MNSFCVRLQRYQRNIHHSHTIRTLVYSAPVRSYAKLVTRSSGNSTTDSQLSRMRRILTRKTDKSDSDGNSGSGSGAEKQKGVPRDEDDDPFHALAEEQSKTAKRPAPRAWKDSAALRRMEERGLTFSTVLERGAERSISGHVYNEVLTDEMRSECALLNSQWERLFAHFPQKELVVRAVTHKSYGTGKVPHNEQLAFIGKHVAEMYITEFLVEKYGSHVSNVKDMSLLRAVYSNVATLTLVGRYDWGLESIIRCDGYNKMSAAKKDSIMAESALAMIGAVYCNAGPTTARQFINETLLFRTPSAIFTYLQYNSNPVQLLHDILFAQGFIIPRKIMNQNGTVHTCSFYHQSTLIGHGEASTAQDAISLAASNALAQMAARVPIH